jgi:ATP/maltotriose-dependent transcriptional regulator MalT
MVLAHNPHEPSRELFLSVLANTEVGVAVIDTMGRALYLNSSAKRLLDAAGEGFPEWVPRELEPMLEQVRLTGAQSVEKWVHGELVLRARLRPLDRLSSMSVLELTVAHAGASREIAELLSRSLHLTLTDSRLLGLLWRGMSNEEIAHTLSVRVGTVKSRLFRLYQKLGVKRRAAAVLRAAEVLG